MSYEPALIYLSKSTTKKLDTALRNPSSGQQITVQTLGSKIDKPVPLLVTKTQLKRLTKNFSERKGTRLTLSNAQLRAIRKADMSVGGGMGEQSIPDIIHAIAGSGFQPHSGLPITLSGTRSGPETLHFQGTGGLGRTAFGKGEELILGAGWLDILGKAVPIVSGLFDMVGSIGSRKDKKGKDGNGFKIGLGITDKHMKDAAKQVQKLKDLEKEIKGKGGVSKEMHKRLVSGSAFPLLLPLLKFVPSILGMLGGLGGKKGNGVDLKSGGFLGKILGSIPLIGPLIGGLFGGKGAVDVDGIVDELLKQQKKGSGSYKRIGDSSFAKLSKKKLTF